MIEHSGLQDEVITCMMPLTISHAELDEGIDILTSAFTEECGWRAAVHLQA
jgi:4-aminobutyrate aminotransferase-like enzyme